MSALVVLGLVIVINGNVYLTAAGSRDNPDTFATVQECEKQMRKDEIALAP